MSDLTAGVIGVGNMGRHHARVYEELSSVDLCGVYDADEERAEDIATKYGTSAQSMEELLSTADLVSIAVPTQYHGDIATQAANAGVDMLIEKPLAGSVKEAQRIAEMAAEADVLVQVGHIERFNPAIQTLLEIIPQLDVLAISADRLGPSIEREIEDTVVVDLMIHDIDVLLSLVSADIDTLVATGGVYGRYATATAKFTDGTIGRLTASRVTQKKTRQLTITARECVVEVDYIDQSVEIHRSSAPGFVERDGDIRYRHESIIERPVVESGEPLKNELSSFVDAIQSGKPPAVTVKDGIEALELAYRIDELAFGIDSDASLMETQK